MHTSTMLQNNTPVQYWWCYALQYTAQQTDGYHSQDNINILGMKNFP